MRTIKELAQEALDANNGASNLSGVVHSFSKAMTELRDIARAEGWESTEKLNTHPIAIVWSNTIENLTDSYGENKYSNALDHLYDIVG